MELGTRKVSCYNSSACKPGRSWVNNIAIDRVEELNVQLQEKIKSVSVLLERREKEGLCENLLIQLGDHAADLAAIAVKGCIAMDLVRKEVDKELDAMGDSPDYSRMLRMINEDRALETCNKFEIDGKKLTLFIMMVKAMSEEFRKAK
jgi:hypothetical protein